MRGHPARIVGKSRLSPKHYACVYDVHCYVLAMGLSFGLLPRQLPILAQVAQRQARQVILDITGVLVVDTQVAQVLVQTAAAVQLLGTRVCVVGIRLEVAQTVVSLNITFENKATYPDLQDAIRMLSRDDSHANLRYDS